MHHQSDLEALSPSIRAIADGGFSLVRIIMGALAGLAVASLVACGRAQSPGPEIKFVIVEEVSARGERDERLYAAVVKPRIESVQSFRVGGRIAARPADMGDHVTQGQVLASLDANDWALNAQTVHGQLTAAIAQRDSARADLARFEKLTREKLMSAAELDRQQHTVAAAVGQVAALTASAREADNKLSYAKLRADADGVVTQVTAEPGQVVSEGAPVITIARTAERELEFSIPEQRRGSIRLGQRVQVSLWSEPATRLEARVRWIAPSADMATRAFAVRAALLRWPEGLLFGMTASVRVPADASADTQVTLPIAAVFDQGGAKAVWVVDHKAGVLRMAAVEVSALDGNRYVVTGLRPGEVVVTAGVHRLRAGDHVAVFAGGEQPTQLAAQH